MKGNLFKKIGFLFCAIFGVGVLASCESANTNDAYIDTSTTTCEVKKYAGDDTRLNLTFAIKVVNNTIFNTKKAKFVIDIKGKKVNNVTPVSIPWNTDETEFPIAHGGNGFVISSFDVTKTEWDAVSETSELPFENILSLEVKSGVFTEFSNIWDTYFVAWIFGIVIFSISFISYLVTICARHYTYEDLKQILAQRASTSFITLLFVLIICLVPLMFAGWVTSVILLGAFVADFVLCYLITIIKSKFARKEIEQK